MGGLRRHDPQARPRQHKYGAKKTGDGFPSKLEAAVYQMLCLREKAGEITNIRRQQVVRLSRAQINYKVDFSYDIPDGSTIYVEAKGMPTPEWKLKARLWEHYGPAPLEVWMGTYKALKLADIITPDPGICLSCGRLNV